MGDIACDGVDILYPSHWFQGGAIRDEIEEDTVLTEEFFETSANHVDWYIVLEVNDPMAFMNDT